MIYVVEAFVEDYLHVLANVKLIQIFKDVYSEQAFTFISPEKHNNNVKKYFDSEKDNIIFETVKNLNSSPKSFSDRIGLIFSRIWRDYNLLNSVFKRCQKNDIIVVTHIHFSSLFFLKLFKKFYPKIILFSVIHGDVEFVYFPKTKEQKVVGFFHKLMFKLKAHNFYYLFLTPISKKILIESGMTKDKETLSIELPTFPLQNKFLNTTNLGVLNKIKIGHVGSAGLRKNVDLFYTLAINLEKSIKGDYLELSTVGVLENTIGPFLNPLVLNHVNNKLNSPLSREIYDQEISKLDYVIFFYGKDDFILRSSAAFFDAIFYEKPIIALRNVFFEDVFRRAGVIGYLCENLEEMEEVISLILNNKAQSNEQYSNMVNNIKMYKLSLRLNDISKDLKQEVILKTK